MAASLAVLKALVEAFNAYDLDRIMGHFADDAVLEMPRGPDPWGRRYVGKAAVREGLKARFDGTPDVHYGDDSHFIDGDMGISQWTVSGTMRNGERIRARGCDFYSFRGDRIVKKDSFWKIVEK
jgi:ketosteroid isomerase-like protein